MALYEVILTVYLCYIFICYVVCVCVCVHARACLSVPLDGRWARRDRLTDSTGGRPTGQHKPQDVTVAEDREHSEEQPRYGAPDDLASAELSLH